jgi:hypothetical protein
MLGEEFEDAWFLGQLSVTDPHLEHRWRPPELYWQGEPRIRVVAMRAALLDAISRPASRVA